MTDLFILNVVYHVCFVFNFVKFGVVALVLHIKAACIAINLSVSQTVI